MTQYQCEAYIDLAVSVPFFFKKKVLVKLSYKQKVIILQYTAFQGGYPT